MPGWTRPGLPSVMMRNSPSFCRSSASAPTNNSAWVKISGNAYSRWQPNAEACLPVQRERTRWLPSVPAIQAAVSGTCRISIRAFWRGFVRLNRSPGCQASWTRSSQTAQRAPVCLQASFNCLVRAVISLIFVVIG